MMNLKKTVAVLTLTVLSLLLLSCQGVLDVLDGTQQNPVLSLTDVSVEGGETTFLSGDTVVFNITVRNEGAVDSAGRYVYGRVGDRQFSYLSTGEMRQLSNKDLQMSWIARAGDHTFNFVLDADPEATIPVESTKSLKLRVNVRSLEVVEEETTTEEVAKRIESIMVVGNSGEKESEKPAVSLTEILERPDEILKDETVSVNDNQRNLIQTVSQVTANVPNSRVSIASGVPINKVVVQNRENTTAPTTSAVVLPLARTVTRTIEEPVVDESGSPVLNEDGTPQVNIITEVSTALDTTSFLVNIATEIDEVSDRSVSEETEEIVETRVSRPVAVPLAISIRETVREEKEDGTEDEEPRFSEVVVQNGFGGISISPTGAVTLLDGSRSVGSGFWVVMSKELNSAAEKLAVALRAARSYSEYTIAITAFVSEFTSIVLAYDLQRQVVNQRPEITVRPSTRTYSYTDPENTNNRIRVTYDVFFATVTDDKPGAYFLSEESFDPGRSTDYASQRYTFEAIDSDGATTRYTVVSRYRRQVLINANVHDQGGIN